MNQQVEDVITEAKYQFADMREKVHLKLAGIARQEKKSIKRTGRGRRARIERLNAELPPMAAEAAGKYPVK